MSFTKIKKWWASTHQVTQQVKFKETFRNSISNYQADAFYDSVRGFYKAAYKYYVKLLPSDNTLYKNCTFIDFQKTLSSSFDQVELIVERFSARF